MIFESSDVKLIKTILCIIYGEKCIVFHHNFSGDVKINLLNGEIFLAISGHFYISNTSGCNNDILLHKINRKSIILKTTKNHSDFNYHKIYTNEYPELDDFVINYLISKNIKEELKS